MSMSSLDGVLKDFAMSLSSNLASFRYAHTMRRQSSCSRCASLIISHQSMMVLMRATSSWGSSLGFAMMSSNSASRTCVFTSCVIPSCILLRKAEAFALVAFHSSSVPGGVHCAWSSSAFVPRAAKT